MKNNDEQVIHFGSLPNSMIKEVSEYAAQKKISNDEVIRLAVRNFLDDNIRSALERTFKLASEDPEMDEMAEWGIADYLEQLKELEN